MHEGLLHREGVTPHHIKLFIVQYVYIIKSIKTKDIYIGRTINWKKRIIQHNKDESYSTKGKGPWKMIYYEAYNSKEDAKLREKRLKYYGRALAQLKRRLQNSLL